MNTRDELVEWLRDAYAMEKAMEAALQKRLKNEAAAPVQREMATLHLAETQSHFEAVEACLKKLGAAPSPSKTTLAQGMEIIRSLDTAFAEDERVKDVLEACQETRFRHHAVRALVSGGSRVLRSRSAERVFSNARRKTGQVIQAFHRSR